MRSILIILLIVSILSIYAYTVPTDPVLDSLGECSAKAFYTSGWFQDFTNYAKYTYEDADISNNPYFEEITSENKSELDIHIENFEKWVKIIGESEPKSKVVRNYDFDDSIISFDDYLYIYDDPDYTDLGNYDVYFFDTATLTLYYFHNNI